VRIAEFVNLVIRVLPCCLTRWNGRHPGVWTGEMQMRRLLWILVVVAILGVLAMRLQAADTVTNRGSAEYTLVDGSIVAVESNEVSIVKGLPPKAGAGGSFIAPGMELECTFEVDLGPSSEIPMQRAYVPSYGCVVVEGSVRVENTTGNIVGVNPLVVEFTAVEASTVAVIRYRIRN